MNATSLQLRPAIEQLEDSQIVDVWKMGFTIPDVVGLWVGEGDLPTTKFICDAAAAALAEGKTFYTYKRGLPELRQALVDYHRRLYGVELTEDRIAVTSSGMNAMMLIVQSLIGAGDNMVCVTPVWPNIFRAVEIMGGEPRQVAMTGEGDGWHLDLDRLFEFDLDQRATGEIKRQVETARGQQHDRGDDQKDRDADRGLAPTHERDIGVWIEEFHDLLLGLSRRQTEIDCTLR